MTLRRPLTSAGALLALALATTAFVPIEARAADQLLAGAIKSAAGETLGGVTVSAKAEGSTITTTVYTDEAGRYYFPPMAAGKYRVWAQALTFETAKGEVDLSAKRQQDFTLAPMKDFVRQLPGDVILASLPEDTADDARLKTLVRNNCTGCHTPSYILQHKFDADGSSRIIDLMKNVNVSGVYIGHERKPNGVLEYNQKELAAYLARARGPGESSMKMKLRPRPSGETARAVIKEYDVPIQQDGGFPASSRSRTAATGRKARRRASARWCTTPGPISTAISGFTSNVPNKNTIGRVDAKTGETKDVPRAEVRRARRQHSRHGARSAGTIWFNVNTGRGSLGKLDPKTGKIRVYTPPTGMQPTGGATTVDFDGGHDLVVGAGSALRFDPQNSASPNTSRSPARRRTATASPTGPRRPRAAATGGPR